MISKATGWQQDALQERNGRLKGNMRAVMNWAALEEHDAVLDLFCGDGIMLDRISKSIRLYSCGMCSDPGQARAVRESLTDADIVYGSCEDIPWRNNAFDVILGSEMIRRSKIETALREINRVLRPGGQVVLVTKLTDSRSDDIPGKNEVMRLMQANGFENVSWRMSCLHGVAIGWKKKEE